MAPIIPVKNKYLQIIPSTQYSTRFRRYIWYHCNMHFWSFYGIILFLNVINVIGFRTSKKQWLYIFSIRVQLVYQDIPVGNDWKFWNQVKIYPLLVNLCHKFLTIFLYYNWTHVYILVSGTTTPQSQIIASLLSWTIYGVRCGENFHLYPLQEYSWTDMSPVNWVGGF